MALRDDFRFNVRQEVDFLYGKGYGRTYHGVVEARYAAIGGNTYDVYVKGRGRFQWVEERRLLASPKVEVSRVKVWRVYHRSGPGVNGGYWGDDFGTDYPTLEKAREVKDQYTADWPGHKYFVRAVYVRETRAA